MGKHRYAMYVETPENTRDDLLGLTGNWPRACERVQDFSRQTPGRVFRVEDGEGKQTTRRFLAGAEIH